ncbi:hypothetical protein ACEWY4_008426 [Coilia grayii]|uniref:Uncharacterized protein n=1 Tax=Coilia grayii TaxID=363190 RepID=A0ABD1KAV6_9TELE
MSFTGPFLAHGEDDATFPPSTDTPDCAVHMMPVREDDCKQRPLANCVHTWEFHYLYDSQPECSPLKSQLLTIEPNQIHQSLPYTPPHNVSSNITNCEGMNALLRDSETDQLLLILKVLIEWDPHIKARIKECRSLLLLERLLHRSTNEAQQTVSDSLGVVSGFVTVYNSTTQVNNSFFISLPSQARQQTSVQKGPCVSVDDDVTMEVPKDVLSQLRNRSGGQLNIGAFWFHQDSLFPVDDPNVTLLSPRVVALDLGQEISGLQQPINISFYLKQPINSSIYLQQPINSSVHQNVSTKPQCVFWDVKTASSASWNGSGCVTVVGDGKVTCSCDHLSVFAVLLTPVGIEEPLSASELFTLTVTSRVGCSVSLAFLFLTLLTHACYKKGPSENSLWIHLQVCVSLLLLNLSFLLNDFLSILPGDALCVAMATLTHYALLSVLTWFAIEGLHLYLLFIRVFNIHIHRYLLKLALLGWGLPTIPVAIGVGLGTYGVYKMPDTEGAGTQLCWVKDTVLTILTYSYFLLVLLFNITMFSVVLHQVLKARYHSPAAQERGLSKGMLLSLLALSWMLGISWGVMALSGIPRLQKVTLFIFCTINGLHGFFLFLRYATLLRKEKQTTSSSNSTNLSKGNRP